MDYSVCKKVLDFQVNKDFHPTDETRVVLKVLGLIWVREWLIRNELIFVTECQDLELKEYREPAKNEILIYEHIWKHNQNLSSDSENFIHVPRIIGFGEAKEKKVLDVAEFNYRYMFLARIWCWKS
ncbi:unnamed protein product [Ambrosiozyma monospora]|uniref:Unnamed protein product n=1 Tax=Ambrosiozyma monospora TaxID=43982 RepID=A0ACB5ST77_AMBMO|nr:unnamed protein product [Ambrosiozyma monospora]